MHGRPLGKGREIMIQFADDHCLIFIPGYLKISVPTFFAANMA